MVDSPELFNMYLCVNSAGSSQCPKTIRGRLKHKRNQSLYNEVDHNSLIVLRPLDENVAEISVFSEAERLPRHLMQTIASSLRPLSH